MVPFTTESGEPFNYKQGDMLYVENIRTGIMEGREEFVGKMISDGKVTEIKLYCKNLTDNEKKILLEGCLINFYASNAK